MPTEKEVLQFKLQMQVDEALKNFKTLNRSGSSVFKALNKGSQLFSKGLKKVADINLRAMGRKIKDSVTGYKKLHNYNVLIGRLQQKMLKATDSEKRKIKEEIEDKKRLLKMAKEEHKGASILHGAGRAGKKAVFGIGGVVKGAFKVAGALLRKDIEGAIEQAAETLKSITSGAGAMGKGISKAGDFFWKKGSRFFFDKAKKMGAKGGVSGKAGMLGMGALGGLSKAVGGLGKVLGPIVQALSALGPVITILGSVVSAIVKLFIDAEAQAKEMNKQIMQVSGSAAIFYKNAQRSDAAISDLGDKFKDIRDSATQWSNIKWGISKEDHMAVLTTLSQEGVQLEDLQTQYKDVGLEAKDATKQAQAFGQAVHVAVAYSRQFGVSLQELTQFQGEMMTEMGQSLTDVQLSFHMMTKGAAESGIATNKFFSIIRGVSADLNLYNTRMEDAVHMLTLLGKVMNPKNAQQFLSSSMQAVKNMGRAERLKLNILSGSEGGKVVDRDIKFATDDLAEKMSKAIGGAIDPDEMGKKIAEGGVGFEEALDKMPEKMRSTYKEAYLELQTKKQMRKGGAFGTGEALGESSVGAQLQVLDKSMAKFGGDFSLAREMMSDQFGISIEQSKNLYKMRIAMTDQRKMLKKNIHSDATRAALEKAGIKLTGDDAKDQQAIDEAGYDQLLHTLDEGDQKALTDSAKEQNYAQQTAQYTSTLSDKIEALSQWMMNQLYNLFSSIYDTIADMAAHFDILGSGTDARRQAKMQIAAGKPQARALWAMAAKAPTAEDFAKAVSAAFEKTVSDTGDRVSQFAKAANGDKIGGTMSGAVQKGLDAGKSLQDAMDAAKVPLEDQVRLLNKIQAQLMPDQSKDFQATGPAPGDNDFVGPPGPGDVKSPAPGDNDFVGPPGPGAAPSAPAKAVQTTADNTSQIQASSAQTATTTEKMNDQMENMTSGTTLNDLYNVLWVKGIKLNESFMKDKFWKEGHDRVLDANRESLLEYFLYSKLGDADKMAQGVAAGTFSASDVHSLVAGSRKDMGWTGPMAPAHADGAYVTSVQGGIAKTLKAPAHEAFTSIGKGEKITPAGGGGGTGPVNVHVNGVGGHELARIIQGHVMNGIADYKRRSKFG